MSELTHHAAHLKHGEAQINGAADWHNRTGGTLPAKLSCYEAVAVSAELARLRAEVEKWQSVAVTMSAEREHNANEAGRLRAEVERLTKQNRDEESWWKEKHDYQARAERFEAEVERLKELLRIESSSAQHALAWAERAEAELKQMQSSALTWARFAAVKADGEDVAKQRAERAEAALAEAVDGVIDGGNCREKMLYIHVPCDARGHMVGQPVKVLLPAIDAAMKEQKS